MANELQWCNTVFRYPTLSPDGIDWTKPQNNAWRKFADIISDVERLYIRRTWEKYTSNTNGKYNFFDKINLSPTYGEYLGFQKLSGTHSQDSIQLTRLSQGDNQYTRYLPNPTNIKWVHPIGSFERLKSQIVNVKKEFTSTTILDENDISHPLEEEFKLSWMRDLVERGIEGEMGPFYKSPTAKTDSRGLFPFKINQKSLNRFLKYKLDGHSYQKSYLLDFLEDNIKKSNTREWKESKFARPDPDECKLILKHSLNGGQPLTPNNTETFVLTFFAHGKDTGNPINNKWTDIIEPRQFNTNTGRTITVEATGVMPTLGKDNSIKGWIRLPEIFGDLELPWPFVWKFIAKRGIIQKSVWERNKTNPIPVIQIADDLLTRRGINPSTKPSFTENQDEFLRYDARSRFWHFRYTTDDIPDRELMFYIRLYHGAGGAVGDRFTARDRVSVTVASPRLGTYSETLELPDEVQNNIIQCGGIPKSGYKFSNDLFPNRFPLTIIAGETTVLPYKDQMLRSKYICLIHDIVGYPRYTNTRQSFEQPSNNNGVTLDGSDIQIVNHNTFSGRYSLIGGASDRKPIQENNYMIIDFKKSARIDVQQNHIPLQRLLYKQSVTPEEKSTQDTKDRYVTFDSIISPTTAQFKQSPIAKIGITRDVQLYYHSHHVNHQYNFKRAFNPGLLSYKELQFLYELVSYLHYGKLTQTFTNISGNSGTDADTIVLENFSSIWQPNDIMENRWSEIGSNVSMNILFPEYNDSEVRRPFGSDETPFSKNNSFLMDYISWTAPTNEQFGKIKFSSYNDTFVSRYRDKIRNSGNNWKNPISYPFHALAEQILKSEDSEKPLVPAWIHYKYISRRINSESKKFRHVELGIDSGENEIIKRVFGGIIDDVNSGVLVALPMFVLGGRPDLQNDQGWDSKWGINPFSIDSDGKLRVGDLDAVLDKWAQKKKHNGKYVSAMEILFWIRHKHGLSAAPMQRTVEHFLPENATKISTEDQSYNTSISNGDYWPPEAAIKKIKSVANRFELQGGGNATLKETEILPTETLHNVPILTSYYFPIMSDTTNFDEFLRKNADPLMDFQTSPADIKRPETSLTGWNSQYAAYWPGASPVKTLLSSRPSIFDTEFPKTSNIRTTFVEPYHVIMANYRAWENDFGYKNNDKILVTGFESKKIITTENIKSWFRASKLIQVDTEYSIYVANGLSKREGELDSVIAVQGKFFPTGNTSENGKDTVFFISGEKRMQNPTGDYIKNDLIRRPWYIEFGDNSQQELSAWCDDYSLSTKDCMPQYRYMRHLIQPFQFPYVYAKTLEETAGWYSAEQMELMNISYMSMWPFHSKLSKDLGTYILDINKGTDRAIKDKAILQSAVLNVFTLTGISGGINTGLKESRVLVSTLKNFVKNTKDVLNWTSKTLFWSAGIQTKFVKYAQISRIKDISEEAAKNAQKLDDFKKETFDPFFNLFKYIVTLSTSNPSSFDEDFKYASYQLGADFGLYFLQNWVVSKTFEIGVKWLLKTLTTAGSLDILPLVVRGGSGGHLFISVLFTYFSLEVSAAINRVRNQSKMDELWGILNKASEPDPANGAPLGYLEGPYLQSKGRIRIKKGVTGIVPLGYEIDPSTGVIKDTKDVDTKKTRGYGLFDTGVPDRAQRGDEYASYIEEINKKFNVSSGPIDIIGKTMISGSCECEFLLDLISDSDEYTQYLQSGSFQKVEKGTPYNRLNWETGPFRRQFKTTDKTGRVITRETILDDAPTYEDSPFVYQLAQRPTVRTDGLLFNSTPSNQLSDLQLPGSWIPPRYRPGNVVSYIRVNGQNGLFASPQSNPRCPRFWWPTILDVRVSDDLCDYIARNGKYPKNRPEICSPCDGGAAARNLAISVLTERNQPTDVSAVSDFIGGAIFPSEKPLKYTRTAYASGSRIPYTNTFNNDINLTHIRSTNNSDSDTFKRELGNTVFTMEGVDGIATPHEREIVKLFRMKHGIDVVDPNNNCCSLGEVLPEGADDSSIGNQARNHAKANNCTYIIKLNTKRFREKVIERCTRPNQQNKQAEQNEEQRKKESQKVGLTADSEFIDQQVLTQYAQLTDPMSIIIPPGGEQDDDPRRRKSRRKKPCLPGCTDCCDDDNLPPGIEPIEELQRRRADTTVANTPNIPITLAATTGGLVGKGVGSVIGGLVSYILADTNSYRLLGYDITDEIVGGSQETMTMDSTAMNSITVQPKRYIINEIWENSFGERRIVTRNAYTPQERDSILNRYKRG